MQIFSDAVHNSHLDSCRNWSAQFFTTPKMQGSKCRKSWFVALSEKFKQVLHCLVTVSKQLLYSCSKLDEAWRPRKHVHWLGFNSVNTFTYNRLKTRSEGTKSDLTCCYCHPEHAASSQHCCQFIFLSGMGYILQQQLWASSWNGMVVWAADEGRAWRPAVWTWSRSGTMQPEYWGGGWVLYSAPWLRPSHQADGSRSGLITFFIPHISRRIFFFLLWLEVCRDSDDLHVLQWLGQNSRCNVAVLALFF